MAGNDEAVDALVVHQLTNTVMPAPAFFFRKDGDLPFFTEYGHVVCPPIFRFLVRETFQPGTIGFS
jgi:hypothetical protein